METISIDAAPIAAHTSPRCPVTRSREVIPLADVDGYAVWRCPASATDFVWPVPDDAELKRYYDRTEWFEGGEPGGYANYDAQTDFSLPMLTGLLDGFADDGSVRYVLDVGCGYGTHLALAADRGWKCFGVELSDHARNTAIARHGDRMLIVEQIEELIPHEFDLLLMLDVLEHVGDPYALMFRLFNRGLIGPRTRIVITTPNARSSDAVRDGGKWIYRHPPSHLVYYSARSLVRLLTTLQFGDVRVRGTSPIAAVEGLRYPDEDLGPDESLSGFAGLICEAVGSRFYAFMLERYVPGTWSKLAEYEHVPRYQFARQFARGARVLDFGCGTGYGSRFLADAADDVLGLDIDEDALRWAAFWHDTARLHFERHADLGATLPSASFDLVTCFEMIEHVDHAMQTATVASLARVVKPTGKLLISTPNPAVTANYGANPYHLREMNEAEFIELLAPHFAHVAIYRQWVRPSILIGTEPIPSTSALTAERLSSERMIDEPPAFVAVCSHQPIDAIDPFVSFDGSFDMVLSETLAQKAMTGLRFDNYLLREGRDEAERIAAQALADAKLHRETDEHRIRALDEQAATISKMRDRFEEQAFELVRVRQKSTVQEDDLRVLREQVSGQEASLRELGCALAERDSDLAARREQAVGLQALAVQRTAEKDEWMGHYRALENTRVVRLARILHGTSGSASPLIDATYLIGGGLVPRALKSRVAPLAHRLRRKIARPTPLLPESGPATRAVPADADPGVAPTTATSAFAPYAVKPPAHVHSVRTRVLHVIANFMTGGSSRLVVDLLEHLGSDYEQRILTSFIPSPVHYVGIDIEEIRHVADSGAMRRSMARFDPQIVHVHYWGDVDEPWYRAVLTVAAERGCTILQNINTPVAPFSGVPIARNVFVSRYVLDHFGDGLAHNKVIYPGSDFSLFTASPRSGQAKGCIGMVYRLERDKLDEHAIVPFIEAARTMPGLKCLIVGGGSLLQTFKDRVLAAGLTDAFEFTGYVSYANLPALYERMDVFVAPIWKESFGQVSAFAMNMGIPVIGYDVGAIPEIVADPSLVAPAGEAPALAAIAVGLVKDDAARASIGIANRERASRLFSVEAMIGSYRELYGELQRGPT